MTVIPAPRRAAAPSRRAGGTLGGSAPPLPSHGGLGSRGFWGKRFAWGKTAGLTERKEEPSLFWFLSKHF